MNSIEGFVRDIRYGFRMLRKSPGVTAVVVTALALGVGAIIPIFSIVNGFLLRPLPVPSPEQITVLAIQQKDAPVGSGGFSYPEFVDFRSQAAAFSDTFGLVLSVVQVAADDRSDQCFANYVSGNFFSSLAVKPAWGRLLFPSDGEGPGQPPLVVLDYAYWQKRFSGDPNVVGRQVRINGKSALILGVAPRQFHGMFSVFKTDVYLPMSAISLEESTNIFWNNRDHRRILAFSRLKPEISLPEAQSFLDVITARLATQYPATDRWFTVRDVPERSARPIPYANTAFVAISGLFLALAAFVLLLACMNVENILLARYAARQREMGIRAALGAGTHETHVPDAYRKPAPRDPGRERGHHPWRMGKPFYAVISPSKHSAAVRCHSRLAGFHFWRGIGISHRNSCGLASRCARLIRGSEFSVA